MAEALVVCLVALIFPNAVAAVLQAMQSPSSRYAAFFGAFTAVSVLAFAAEYAPRVWTRALDERFRRPILGRVRFVPTLVDVVAILPFFVPAAT